MTASRSHIPIHYLSDEDIDAIMEVRFVQTFAASEVVIQFYPSSGWYYVKRIWPMHMRRPQFIVGHFRSRINAEAKAREERALLARALASQRQSKAA